MGWPFLSRTQQHGYVGRSANFETLFSCRAIFAMAASSSVGGNCVETARRRRFRGAIGRYCSSTLKKSASSLL